MIKSKFETLKNWFKKRSKKQIALGAFGLIILFFILNGIFGGSTKTTIIKAEKGTVEEEVLVTGETQSRTEVNLGFERSGRVVQNNVEVGSRVAEGATLAVLDQSDLAANLQKADANLNQALAELNSIKKKSGSSFQSSTASLVLSEKDAYVQADNAVRNVADQFFVNPQGQTPEFRPSFVDAGATFNGNIDETIARKLSNDRRDIEDLLKAWQAAGSQSASDLGALSVLALTNLGKVRVFIDQVASAINSLSVTDSFYNLAKYNATLDGYKKSVASARASLVTAASSLLDAEEAYVNASENVSTSGGASTFDTVLVQEAKVESLRADKSLILADLSKTVLRSPIAGLVTRADAKRGEIVPAAGTLITIIADDKLQVEARVSEVNISKVKVGNAVRITFDAISGEVFSGKVIYIDPGSTLVDGVATYKVTIAFEATEEADLSLVRSGLSANLNISTRIVEEAVKVPEYAVTNKGGKSFVTLSTEDGPKEIEIVTGLRGKDGTIEVVSGLEGSENLEVSVNK